MSFAKLVLSAALGISAATAQRLITTAAGTDWLLSAEGKPAVSVPLSSEIRGIGLDSQGNLYIPDPQNYVVLKVGSDGAAHVVAGNGIVGFSGDGGPATSASLLFPSAVLLDSTGVLYIADGNRIRKVAADGTISTIAGTGAASFSGDGGPAARATFDFIYSLAMDAAGDLLLCDLFNHRVRKITPSGIVSTVAGNGAPAYSGDGGQATAASLNQPAVVQIDSQGQLYIADSENNAIRRVAADGTISTFAGTGKFGFSGDGGPAQAATLARPYGLVLASGGAVYISDLDNHRIRRIDAAGIITTIAGTGNTTFSGDGGPPSSASFFFPGGLAFDAAGRLLVTDSGHARIRAIALGTSITTIAGNGLFRFTPNGTPASQTFLFQPSGVAIDSGGNLYVADTSNSVVRKRTLDGLMRTVAGTGVRSFGGDGIAGTASGLDTPRGLTLAANGDLILTDTGSGRVRRLAANGVITTLAGNFTQGFGGDNGPATQAILNQPYAAVFDAAGSLYIADTGNNRVRKVANNVITTFAGNGVAQSLGDGQAAASASLNTPLGLAADAAGNLYISEYNGFRIRKVTPNGNISTFAGTGKYGSSGDGGPAASAAIGYVAQMAFDAQGNLYFAETFPGKIRKIAADGTVSTVAGTGQQGFSGDGGFATAAMVNQPAAVAIGADGGLYIADTGNSRIREVIPTGPAFGVSVSQLSFTATSGGAPSAQQAIALGSSLNGLAFNGLPFIVTSSTTSGGAWLHVTPANGTTPTALAVSVDPSNLGAGAYNGVIQINAPGATPSQTLVTVSLTVSGANPTKISLSTTQLGFSTQAGADPSFRALSVSNAGGGVLSVTVTATTVSGGGWLAVTPASGSATPANPLSLIVSVTPGTLPAGTYSGSVQITSSLDQVTVPVTMAVSVALPSILLSQTGLSFDAVAQGGAPLPQSFAILNTGQGAMNWTAAASTLSGGSGWLSISPPSGTVTTPFLDVSPVNVSVNATGLAPGKYYGQVSVSAVGATNSPQVILIVMNVLPPGTNPGPEVRPSGVVFVGPAGSTPGSQNIAISNPTQTPLTYASSPTTIPSGGNWLQYLPAGATINPNQPLSLVLQSDFTSLAPGIQRGVVTFIFMDGSIRTVSVLSVVGPQGTGSVASPESARANGGCTASSLVVHPTLLNDPSSSVTQYQPATLQFRVVDNCGNAVTSGTVVAVFSNGDPQVKLVHTGGGTWSGTWQPRNASVPQTTVQVVAFLGQGVSLLSGSVNLTVSIQTGAPAPLPLAVLNAASLAGTVVAPGAVVSIFGQELADSAQGADTVPFPSQLSGTQVLLGGRPLPLRYVAGGQINAQIPFDLAVNTAQQLVVQRDATLSVPQDLLVAPAQPAVYTQDQSGQGPGVIVDANTGLVVTAGAATQAGHTLVIYCNGLGPVNPPLPPGAPAPLNGPLSKTVNPVTVTIGGLPAQVDFAGLVPGYPDLYQVNAVVPSAVVPAPAVPVVLNIAGQSSPPVTIAVQ